MQSLEELAKQPAITIMSNFDEGNGVDDQKHNEIDLNKQFGN